MTNGLELRNPNEEQELAIKHHGGVLLSAGAGSGKTFVLVEHLVYLFEEFSSMPINQQKGSDEFANALKDYFSEIVLMTFTKKAAGELSLRLQKRFELGLARAEAGLESLSLSHWEAALSAIPYVYVGTIHGYCYRLINQGLIPGFSGSEEMINDVDFAQKIDGLIDLWFEKQDRESAHEYLETLVLNKKSLKQSFKEIFSDTDLRMLWSSSNLKSSTLEKEVELIKQAFRAFSGYDWDELTFSLSDATPDSKKPPKYLEFLNDFYEVTKIKEDVFQFIEKSTQVFDSLARFPSASKKTAPDEVHRALAVIKLWREFLSKYGTDLIGLKENFPRYEGWGVVIDEIYNFLEKNYLMDRGLTFTDLEFYCWKAVQDDGVCHNINQGYKYFIIDEFQDTSKVQFEIIKRIINNDMSKVFSVGDVKQAIYGFRGGELGVFKQAQADTYQNLTLKNNYRSCSRIISFNNSLFKELLPLGKDYTGEDLFSVPMVEQAVPEGKEEGGELHKINIEVACDEEGKKSLTPNEQNYIEAYSIFNYLKQNGAFEDEICFLYRKLSPSKFLIQRLMQENIGFTCQVKVSLSEDPMICMFLEYARVCAFPNDENIKNQSLYYLSMILHHLKSDLLFDKEVFKLIPKFYVSYGLLGGFKRFLWSLRLSAGGLEQNWPTIVALSKASEDKASLVFENVRGFIGGNYSLDFQYGQDTQKIKIMTTHASKGLEFSTVVLMGIHTNGVSKGGSGFFGKLPLSYIWLGGMAKSKRYRSPTFIYENELNKAKEFAEFKRLFYVATTRAVNRIVWCNLSFKGREMSFSKSSWIQGLRLWEGSEEQTQKGISTNITLGEMEYSLESLINPDDRLDLQAPIYHKDNLGIEIDGRFSNNLGLGAELSVTRLAMLAQCPRKFFLKNVVKIDEKDLELFHRNAGVEDDDLIKSQEEQASEADDFEMTGKSSSATRGTEVHRCLEFAIKRNFILPSNNELDDKGETGVQWVLDLLRPLKAQGVELHSEVEMKFPIFGQMVSGTPDLYFYHNDVIEIWDFKTGTSRGKDLAAYWLQLMTYAKALSSLGEKSKESSVRLVLAFVDDQEIVERNVSVGKIELEIFKYWQLLSDLEQKNTKHCRYCEFDKICQR